MSGEKTKIKKAKIIFDLPIMPGTVSSYKIKCGKPNCCCASDPSKLHGPYYKWGSTINGKRVSRTMSKEEAEECRRRINNYKKLKAEIQKLLDDGLKNAPWKSGKEDSQAKLLFESIDS